MQEYQIILIPLRINNFYLGNFICWVFISVTGLKLTHLEYLFIQINFVETLTLKSKITLEKGQYFTTRYFCHC